MSLHEESRTAKSFKNSAVALGFYCVNLVLQFFSRRVFLEYLGAEILGLNTTLANLLQFLNLAELGIGAAVGYSLYKPLAVKEHRTISEIVSVQGYLYHRIGWMVLAASAILVWFFPLIFEKAEVSGWYIYATYIVLLIGTLAGYFFNYKQIVLTSDQKDYKLNSATQSIKLGKVVLQILAISLLCNGYIWWLALELVASLITVWGINYVLKQEYPWLHTDISSGRKLRKEYSQITIKTKQIFFHKIAGFILTQSSPLVIYAYASLTLVAIYGNYMLIVVGVTTLLNAVFNSMSAGVGNLVVEGNRERILSVFRELFSSRFFIVVVICFGVYTLADKFIILWVGREYLLDNLSLVLIVVILYLNTIRGVVDSYIAAYGMYQDIWAPIVEATSNLGLSILFGYFWGLHGILCGVIASLLLIIFLWKPYFLFHYGLKVPIQKYITLYAKHLFVGVCCWLVTIRLFYSQGLSINMSNDSWIHPIMAVLFFALILLVTLYVSEKGMRNFIVRCIRFVQRTN